MRSSKKNPTDLYMVKEDTSLIIQIRENQLWGNIRRAAKTNVALADILNQAKMLYAIIKKETN